MRKRKRWNPSQKALPLGRDVVRKGLRGRQDQLVHLGNTVTEKGRLPKRRREKSGTREKRGRSRRENKGKRRGKQTKPVIISYMRVPKDHQSTARAYPSPTRISGAAGGEMRDRKKTE